jgi:hypothetical protein
MGGARPGPGAAPPEAVVSIGAESFDVMNRQIHIVSAFLVSVGAILASAASCEPGAGGTSTTTGSGGTKDAGGTAGSAGFGGSGGAGGGGDDNCGLGAGGGRGFGGSPCAGGAMGCASASDCPPEANDCITAICVAGCCGTADTPSGQSCSDDGGVVCNGAGLCVP